MLYLFFGPQKAEAHRVSVSLSRNESWEVFAICLSAMCLRYERSAGLIQNMQLFARLKADGLARRNRSLGAGARIAANPGLAGAHIKDAKTTQFNALTLRHSLFEALKNGIHGMLCLGTRQSGAVDHAMQNVLFNQGFTSGTNCMLFLSDARESRFGLSILEISA